MFIEIINRQRGSNILRSHTIIYKQNSIYFKLKFFITQKLRNSSKLILLNYLIIISKDRYEYFIILSKLIQLKETSSNTIFILHSSYKNSNHKFFCTHPVPPLFKKTNYAPSFRDPYRLSDELDKRATKIGEVRCARSRNAGRIIWHDWAS